jgi:hypothetical protein
MATPHNKRDNATVRRVVAGTAAVLMGAGVVVIFLVALYPGFLIRKVEPRIVRITIPSDQRFNGPPPFWSCWAKGAGTGRSTTAEVVCTPDRP